MRGLLNGVCVAAYLMAVSTGASAQHFSDFWQSAREAFNTRSNKACQGDPFEVRTIAEYAKSTGHPVAVSTLGYLGFRLSIGKCETLMMLLAEDPALEQVFYDTNSTWNNGRPLFPDYYLQAARGGYPVAQQWVGQSILIDEGHYSFGPDTALMFMQSAWLSGWDEPAYFLGYYYFHGKGFEEDHEKAQHWFDKVRPESNAYVWAGYYQARLIEEQPSPSSGDLALAISLYDAAANSGFFDAKDAAKRRDALRVALQSTHSPTITAASKLRETSDIPGVCRGDVSTPWTLATPANINSPLDYMRALPKRDITAPTDLFFIQFDCDDAAKSGFFPVSAISGDISIQRLANRICAKAPTCGPSIRIGLEDTYEKQRDSVHVRYRTKTQSKYDFFKDEITSQKFRTQDGEVIQIPTEMILAVMHMMSGGDLLKSDHGTRRYGLMGVYSDQDFRRVYPIEKDADGVVLGPQSRFSPLDTVKRDRPDFRSLYNPALNLAAFTDTLRQAWTEARSKMTVDEYRQAAASGEMMRIALLDHINSPGEARDGMARYRIFETALKRNTCDTFRGSAPLVLDRDDLPTGSCFDAHRDKGQPLRPTAEVLVMLAGMSEQNFGMDDAYHTWMTVYNRETGLDRYAALQNICRMPVTLALTRRINATAACLALQ